MEKAPAVRREGRKQNIPWGLGSTFKVIDARIDARPGNSNLGLPASGLDTSFDNDKPGSRNSPSRQRT
jgi:hypothetical protein